MKGRKIESIVVDDDTLVYRVTGDGPALLCIAGGGGDGDLFLPLADELASAYKVITYDRRSNAGSTINHPDEFSIRQQAKDAIAILNEVGVSSAYMLGNSSGAVIALEILRLFPDRVEGIIAHEPPIAKAHPQKDAWLAFFEKCHEASYKPGGASMAAAKFLFGIEVPAMQLIKAQLKAEKYLKSQHIKKELKVPSKQASKYLIQQELLPLVSYEPDRNSLESHTGKLVLAVGDYAKSNNTFLYQIVEQLSESAGIPYLIFPGHHGSYMDDAENWAKAVDRTIKEYFEGK